jgi:hypothetical protein
MQPKAWQAELAELLEDCAQSLRTRNDRRTIKSFGTALAYLCKRRDHGELLAEELCEQLGGSSGDGHTQRFSFSPGELETLGAQVPRK